MSKPQPSGRRSPKPQPRTDFDVSKIAAFLKALRRWVVWKPLFTKARWIKLPLDVNGNAATGPLANHCRSFDEAVKQAVAGGYGVGIVPGLLEDGMFLAGLDFDRILVPDTDGRIHTWVQDSLRLLNSYAEMSPSVTGARAFFVWRGEPFDPRSRKIEGESSIEAWHSTKFMTVTGYRFDELPHDVMDCTDSFPELYRKLFTYGPHHRAEMDEALQSLAGR
jgi:primase-polymerase (primpol)-like protein